MALVKRACSSLEGAFSSWLAAVAVANLNISRVGAGKWWWVRCGRCWCVIYLLSRWQRQALEGTNVIFPCGERCLGPRMWAVGPQDLAAELRFRFALVLPAIARFEKFTFMNRQPIDEKLYTSVRLSNFPPQTPQLVCNLLPLRLEVFSNLPEQTSTTIQQMCAGNACVSVLVVHGISARKRENAKTRKREGKHEDGKTARKTRKWAGKFKNAKAGKRHTDLNGWKVPG